MRTRVMSFALCAFILIFTIIDTFADDVPVVKGNNIDNAMKMVLAYFSPAGGEVKEVRDGSVIVRTENNVPLKEGMRFSVFRTGEPFYHPVTNELIGYAEDLTGRIEVREEAEGGSYLCSVVRGDVLAGDKIRISSSKIKLAFFQDRKSNWTVSEAFYKALKNSDRFEVLESYAPDFEPAVLSGLAQGLGAEAFLMFSTPVVDEKKFISIKLYWTGDMKQFGAIERPAGDEDVKAAGQAGDLIPTTPGELRPWGSYSIPDGKLIAVGDADGNGTKEIVVSDGSDIRIYSVKEDLRELWLIKGDPTEKYLSIDILDANRNGVAEIFVTSLMSGGGINTSDTSLQTDDVRIISYVLEFDPSEGYRKIQDNMPFFLRVEGNVLLMQEFSKYKIFSGPVYESKWEDGRYQPGRPLALPDDVNIYGFTYVDWNNDGQKQLISFNDKGYLRLFDDKGKQIWKSDVSYGQSLFSFEKKSYSIAGFSGKWHLRSRIQTAASGSGRKAVVVRREPLVETVPGLGALKAEVYTLAWDGKEMKEDLLMSDLPVAITDFRVEGKELFLISPGNFYSFFKKAASGEFSKGSTVYYYIFGEK